MDNRSIEVIKSATVAQAAGTAQKEELAAINEYALRTLCADEVFVFSVVLCDNEIDRDYERFDIPTLKELAVLFTGKTGVFDHSASAKNQAARIFACEAECDAARVTSVGEPYWRLKARAYMLRCDENAALIAEIEAGIKKEVSVGCAVKRVLCSVCSKEVRESPCGHRAGERLEDGRVCHRVLSGALDAYEWSFVAVPAQPAAGVTKARKGGNVNMQELIKKLKSQTLSAEECERLQVYLSEQEELTRCGKEYRRELEDTVVRLMYAKNGAADCAVLRTAAEAMTLTQLREVKKLFEGPENYLASACQLYRENEAPKGARNTEFKI